MHYESERYRDAANGLLVPNRVKSFFEIYATCIDFVIFVLFDVFVN
jgi:hypothetical protein